MKFYVHHDGSPEFTAVFRVPAGSDSSQLRLSDLATWFRDAFNGKHGPDFQLQQLHQLSVSTGPARREVDLCSTVRKVLRDGSDVYIRERGCGLSASNDSVPRDPYPIPPVAKVVEDKLNPIVHQLLETAAKSEAAKNFRQASQIYEQLVSIASPGTETTKLCLGRLVDLWLLVERPSQALTWAREAVVQFPEDPDVLIRLGNCLSHPNSKSQRWAEALTVYTDAEARVKDSAKKRRLRLLRARVLYDSGSSSNQSIAASLIMDSVNEDQSDWDGLFLYAKVARDRGMLADAVRVLLRLLVQRPNHSEVRRDLADILKQSSGLKVLLGELSGEAHTDAALAFLASCVKDYGAVDASIALFSRALALKPRSPSYMLNLIHTSELKQDYQRCISLVAEFCGEYGFFSPLLSMTTVGDILRSVPDVPEAVTGWLSVNSADEFQHLTSHCNEPKACADVLYDAEELDALASIMTAAKVLYVGGALQHAALITQLLQQPVQASQKPLHTTLIRNEAAYLGCVQQILERPDKPCPTVAGANPLFLVGDSHSLSAAWHQVQLRNENRLIVPQLVTGCKVWHLRPESVFYPKVGFQNTVAALPNNAQVIMLLGEIDCREGLLVAVEKCKYDSLQEGISATVGIYLDILKQLQNRGMEIFVHPVPPVLNETRHIVLPFNAALKESIQSSQAGTPSGRKIQWLDFLSDLLSPDSAKLNEELEFDGTHLAPTYVKYLARALALVE